MEVQDGLVSHFAQCRHFVGIEHDVTPGPAQLARLERTMAGSADVPLAILHAALALRADIAQVGLLFKAAPANRHHLCHESGQPEPDGELTADAALFISHVSYLLKVVEGVDKGLPIVFVTGRPVEPEPRLPLGLHL